MFLEGKSMCLAQVRLIRTGETPLFSTSNGFRELRKATTCCPGLMRADDEEI